MYGYLPAEKVVGRTAGGVADGEKKKNILKPCQMEEHHRKASLYNRKMISSIIILILIR